MDQIRIPKVENVICWRQGKSVPGVLILSPHHITFHYSSQPPVKEREEGTVQKPIARQTWISYPMIGHCIYKPGSRGPSVRLRCRDFNFMNFVFEDDSQAKAVYESIRSLTCRLGSLDKLYAFTYQPKTAERPFQGWNLYDPVKEFARMGVVSGNKDCNWRISKINTKYEYSPTYPAVLCVPAVISDNTLKYTASFRSKARIPVLTYLHPVNNCTITRSSQPMVGMRAARSPQDEKLVAAIFETTKPKLKGAPSSPATPSYNQSNPNPVEATEDPAQLEPIDLAALDISEESLTTNNAAEVKIYGAQQSNLIVDARPRVNAIANHLTGRGSERMDGYKSARMAYLDIDNIHVMRKSLAAVVDVLKDTDMVMSTAERPTIDRYALNNSKWLVYIGRLLTGARQIANTIAIQHSHVLIHCSDGWDRTSQLSALAQICLDPFYRTIEGFIVLVEKDWLSFGHMFRWRSGLLSHEEWFEIVSDRAVIRESSEAGTESPDRTENAFEKTLGHVQNLLRRKVEPEDSEGDTDGSPGRTRKSSQDKFATELKETSPIFHQFLDAVYQLLRQFPKRFEFNERFLRRLLYHLYSCQYGTFLFNSEKERVDAKAKERTRSVWDYFLSQKPQFLNDKYDSVIDDNDRDRTRLLLPNANDVRWWFEAFNRSDEEMNDGPIVPLAYPSATVPSIDSSMDKLASSVETTGFMAVSTTDISAPTQSGSGSQEPPPSGPASSTNSASRLGDWASNFAADISANNPLSLLTRSSITSHLQSSKSNVASASPSQNPSSSSLPQNDDPSDAFSGVTLANIVDSSSGASSLTKAQWISGRGHGKASPGLEVEME